MAARPALDSASSSEPLDWGILKAALEGAVVCPKGWKRKLSSTQDDQPCAKRQKNQGLRTPPPSPAAPAVPQPAVQPPHQETSPRLVIVSASSRSNSWHSVSSSTSTLRDSSISIGLSDASEDHSLQAPVADLDDEVFLEGTDADDDLEDEVFLDNDDSETLEAALKAITDTLRGMADAGMSDDAIRQFLAMQ